MNKGHGMPHISPYITPLRTTTVVFIYYQYVLLVDKITYIGNEIDLQTSTFVNV